MSQHPDPAITKNDVRESRDFPLPLFYVGDSLEAGPQPAIFYFSLAAQDSLLIPPLNAPAVQLVRSGHKGRIFAFDLPFHGPDRNPAEAIERWGREPSAVATFIDQVDQTIIQLTESKIIDPKRICLAGLSRGCLISILLAARNPHISHLLLFAPLIHFPGADESEFDPFKLLDQLYDRKFFFLIGNRDVRVGTNVCFDFALQLSEKAFEKGLRSSPIFLSCGPSFGTNGHGTPPTRFIEGTNWIIQEFFGGES
ncbi:MAG: hypothetical protein S4CHLAM102_15510 [Chlamydiia bacterium]|nr:hypothetical protein [Chlamydiia bacterium]